MNIHIVSFVYRLGAEFLEDFEAADGPGITWHIFRHSQRANVIAACQTVATHPNVHVYDYGVDRGLARSLNEGIRAAFADRADAIVMLCDDLKVGPGDIERLASAMQSHPECAYIDGQCYYELTGRYGPSKLDAAALSLLALADIGLFDVNCWPMNFEDVDWMRRATLSGYTSLTLPDTAIVHRACNADAETDLEHDERLKRFEDTRAYYVAKWGGDQTEETFLRPFNDERFDLRIPDECADNPYPAHRRADVMA